MGDRTPKPLWTLSGDLLRLLEIEPVFLDHPAHNIVTIMSYPGWGMSKAETESQGFLLVITQFHNLCNYVSACKSQMF
jgi:hypothetical protein